MSNDNVLFLAGQITGMLLRLSVEELAEAVATPGLGSEQQALLRLVLEHRMKLAQNPAKPVRAP